MPDNLGRYYLSEMRDRIRRELNDVTLVVNTTGVEISSTLTTQLYSNTDLNEALNYSQAAQFQEMWTDHEDIFAQTVYISLKSGWIGPYALPFNLVKLRWIKIKPSSTPLQSIRPDQWQPMAYYDEDLSQGIAAQFGPGGTFRQEGQNIVLNFVPPTDNPNGLMLNVVLMPPDLVKDTDVVQTQFARALQNFMVLDAAVHVGDTRESQVPPHLLEQRERAHVALMATVDNALQPPSVQLYSTRLVKTTYSGRW